MKLTTKLPVSECLNRLTKPTENVPAELKAIIDEKFGSYFLPKGQSDIVTNICVSVKGNDFEILTKGWRKVPGGVEQVRRQYARLTGSVTDRQNNGSIIGCHFQDKDVAITYILLSIVWLVAVLLSLIITSAIEWSGKAWFLVLSFTCLIVLQIAVDMEHRKDIVSFIKVLLEADDFPTIKETK